jgi:hypothetical protein
LPGSAGWWCLNSDEQDDPDPFSTEVRLGSTISGSVITK